MSMRTRSMRTRRGALAAIVVVVALAAMILTARPARAVRIATPPTPWLRPPVDAPIVDPFRAPASPYGPGNRGIEYGSALGAAVSAPAAGTVAFAGVVAGAGFVAIVHADGLRSAVGPLREIEVVVGQRVTAGERLGSAAGAVLLTVRRGGLYLDPAPLLGSGTARVHLVAEPRPSRPPGGTPWSMWRSSR